MSIEQWLDRCRRIKTRVDALAQRVNERRLDRFLLEQELAEQASDDGNWIETVGTALAEMLNPESQSPPTPIILAEQEDYHPIAEDLASDVVEEIKAHEDEYPGTRVVQLARRDYPAGALAAHVVGHLGNPTTDRKESSRPIDPVANVGRMGIEMCKEELLAGMPGVEIEQLDHRRRSRGVTTDRTAEAGQDIVLTIDPTAQRLAESLLDDVCRGWGSSQDSRPIGGAAVMMDVRTGEVLLAASAPRFDPRLFVSGEGDVLESLFNAPDHPLIDRVSKMAISPGSVFKTLTAIALVEEELCDPEAEFFCQGFLHQPDRQRCMIFRHQGVGHAEVTLADALAQSCNVYFFHHGSELGTERMLKWALRFGFGRTTGIDLTSESAGSLPAPSASQTRIERLAAAQALAIGQGELAVTPLQVVRFMAAVANGGRLLRPQLIFDPDASSTAVEEIDLSEETLAAVREGLRRTVSDPEGTAYASARLASVAIAGKTGTAQTSRADHVWFAGYAPAERPRVAFAVVLEHGGTAADTARIARELVARMHRLGYLADHPNLASE
jgi:penicillin-binding protein 2